MGNRDTKTHGTHKTAWRSTLSSRSPPCALSSTRPLLCRSLAPRSPRLARGISRITPNFHDVTYELDVTGCVFDPPPPYNCRTHPAKFHAPMPFTGYFIGENVPVLIPVANQDHGGHKLNLMEQITNTIFGLFHQKGVLTSVEDRYQTCGQYKMRHDRFRNKYRRETLGRQRSCEV